MWGMVIFGVASPASALWIRAQVPWSVLALGRSGAGGGRRVHRAYQTTGDELVLIRPDGYIAAHRPADEPAAVLALAAAKGL